jgi:hypothetical protein
VKIDFYVKKNLVLKSSRIPEVAKAEIDFSAVHFVREHTPCTNRRGALGWSDPLCQTTSQRTVQTRRSFRERRDNTSSIVSFVLRLLMAKIVWHLRLDDSAHSVDQPKCGEGTLREET